MLYYISYNVSVIQFILYYVSLFRCEANVTILYYVSLFRCEANVTILYYVSLFRCEANVTILYYVWLFRCEANVTILYYVWLFRCEANVTIAKTLSTRPKTCTMKSRPNLVAMEIHMFAYFGAGIVMSSWVWNKATLLTWRRFLRKKLVFLCGTNFYLFCLNFSYIYFIFF